MRHRELVLGQTPYALAQADKEPALLAALNELSAHHAAACAPYRRMIEGAFGPGAPAAASLDQVPYLPVRLFKTHDLRSIPDERVYKVLSSSGTTSARQSRVVLDRELSLLQAKVLLQVLAAFLGKERLPMIIVDSPPGGGAAINARYAATLGVMNAGRDHLFCLDAELAPRKHELQAWLKAHRRARIAVFGFTFVVWKFLYSALEDGEIDLSEATLLHTGGWKKLEAERVDNDAYKAALQRRTGLRRIHNFYGMAEQVGAVFVECERGFLHAPHAADVIVRDERSWRSVAPGGSGMIQCLSVLPTSYPGHSILTEDLGTLVGVDDCACGRKGKYFVISGRIPRAELRGCSDTRA